jgi:fructose-1,6-bisphosphatase I
MLAPAQRDKLRDGATIFQSHVRRTLRDNPTTVRSGDLLRLLDDIAAVTHSISAYVAENAAGSVVAGRRGSKSRGLEPAVVTRRLYAALTHDGYACLILDRGTEVPLSLPQNAPIGQYVIALTSLDIDPALTEHAACGTIFSLYSRRSPQSVPGTIADVQQKLQNQVAAGYIMYSSATTLYYTLGSDHGTYSFCLHPLTTQYFLKPSAPLRIPESCSAVYGDRKRINSDRVLCSALQRYCSADNGRPVRMFDAGTVTANFNAAATQGGVVVHYDCHLLCEAGPLSLIAEQLGGCAISGQGTRILGLAIENRNFHQTVTLIAGVKSVVELIREAIQTEKAQSATRCTKKKRPAAGKHANENGKI